jgi:L-threonylcarbamoyladenylate synthase
VIGPAEDGSGWLIYRPGGVSKAALERVLGFGKVQMFRPADLQGAPASLPSPGVGIRHYAPRARLVLVSVAGEGSVSLERRLVETIERLGDSKVEIGVMLPDGWDASSAPLIYRWGPWTDGEMLARRLFAGLRWLDEAGATVIVCPVPEMSGIGEAIRDRLRKAAREK